MKKIKEIEYKDYKISIFYNEETDMFNANSLLGISYNEFDEKLSNFDHGFATVKEAIENIKKVIDKELSKSYKSIEELAIAITDHLTWTEYETCYLKPQILKRLLDNYKINQRKPFSS
jgi:hypothetical protein